MFRIMLCALVLANVLFAALAQAQQIDTTLSDKQIVGKILEECRKLYLRAAGSCACADERTRDTARCAKILKDIPETFKPFCFRKDVTLREVSLYRMQNHGFLDRRCSK